MKALIKKFRTEGAEFYYREWRPKTPKRSLIFLHGIESNSSWLDPLCKLLVKQGSHIFALDRRGSGLNKKDRGYIDSYLTLISDIKSFLIKKNIKKPVYLGGLSWGGKLATLYVQSFPKDFDGLFLISPGIHAKARFPLRKSISILISILLNEMRRFPIPIKEDWFTSNKRYLNFIKNDLLRLHDATARFYFESKKMDIQLKKEIPIHAPIFLAVSKYDDIVDTTKVKKYFTKVSQNLTVKEYPNKHSLQFEVPKQLAHDFSVWVKGIGR